MVTKENMERDFYRFLIRSNAGQAARLMMFLWLDTEEQMQEMQAYLVSNPEATEGQLLWKCRQILGEN